MICFEKVSTDISSATIQADCKIIAQSVFADCSSLTNVKLNDGLLYIDRYAFNESGLTSLVIPNTVISIGDSSFLYIADFEKVYYKGTKEEWDKYGITYDNNSSLFRASKYFYSETEPSDTDNNYWHYVNDEVTEW